MAGGKKFDLFILLRSYALSSSDSVEEEAMVRGKNSNLFIMLCSYALFGIERHGSSFFSPTYQGSTYVYVQHVS